MILGSLTFGKDFWILIQNLGYVMTLWPNAFLQSLWYILMILGSLDLFIYFFFFWMGPKLRVYHGFMDHLFFFFLNFSFQKQFSFSFSIFNSFFLSKLFLFLNSTYKKKITKDFLLYKRLSSFLEFFFFFFVNIFF